MTPFTILVCLWILFVLMLALAAAEDQLGRADAFKLEFLIDKEHDLGFVYYMLMRKERTAGLLGRAASMHIDLEFAETVHAAGDCPESRTKVRALVDARYAAKADELERVTRECAAFWDPVAAEFGRMVAHLTGQDLFYEKYVCAVCAFAPGISSWSGNKIGVGCHLPEQRRRRVLAWELVLSHAYHIVRQYYKEGDLDSWQVWAFAEIASAFVLDEECL